MKEVEITEEFIVAKVEDARKLRDYTPGSLKALRLESLVRRLLTAPQIGESLPIGILAKIPNPDVYVRRDQNGILFFGNNTPPMPLDR